MRSYLLALPLLAAAARPADACSPPQCWAGGFVPRNGATIPENAPGFYFRPATADGAPGDASLVRLTAASDPGTALPFTAIPQPGGDFVLVPDAPLVAGETYTLEDGTLCNGSTTRSTFTAAPAAPLPSSLGTVELPVPVGVAELDVATASGSCSTSVDAAVAVVNVAPSASAEPWEDLFLYETLVDDKPWSPQASINVSSVPGQSWVGRGNDLLYHVCRFHAETVGSGLQAGEHQVRFRASLPGMAATTASLATPALAVTLACQPPGGGGDDDADDGGGCSSGQPASLAFGLLALVIAAGGRRSSRSR